MMKNAREIISEIRENLPKSLGALEVVRDPGANARGLVVCISDLHANIGVQVNMAGIIQFLVEKFKFPLVCVEGASGPADLSVLWSVPRRRRLEFCEQLFRKAYLTGSEYAFASKPELNAELWGVEIPSLYRLHWRAFKANLAIRHDAVLVLSDFVSRLRLRYGPLVTPELRRMLRLRYATNVTPEYWSPGEDRSIDDDELPPLIEYACSQGLPIRSEARQAYEKWSSQPPPVRISREESALFQRWLEDASKPMEQVVQSLRPEEQAQAFHAVLAMFNQLVEMPAPESEATLCLLAFESVLSVVPVTAADELRKALHYMTERLQTLPPKFKEAAVGRDRPSLTSMIAPEAIDDIWTQVSESLSTTTADRLACRLEHTVALLLRFLQLRSLADESQKMLGWAPDEPGEDWRGPEARGKDAICDQLERDIQKLNSLPTMDSDPSPLPLDPVIAVQCFWDYSEAYYSVARQRSTRLAENTATEMTRRPVDRTVLISGGFHTRDIIDWLSKAGFAAAQIIPEVKDLSFSHEVSYMARGWEEE